MPESEFESSQQLDAAQLQACQAVTAHSHEQLSSAMDQIADACEEAVQMPPKKKQCVAFDLSQNNKREKSAQRKHKETLERIESMTRALEGMKQVAELEGQLLNTAEQVKKMERSLTKEVHFSQRVAPGAPVVLHLLEDGLFSPLSEGVQLDRILKSPVLWVAPEGTQYDKNNIKACKVAVKLDAADATHPGRLGFKKRGYKYTFRNAPRYRLCDGTSLNLCKLLDDTWHLGITQEDPHKKRELYVGEFIDIWNRKNL